MHVFGISSGSNYPHSLPDLSAELTPIGKPHVDVLAASQI